MRAHTLRSFLLISVVATSVWIPCTFAQGSQSPRSIKKIYIEKMPGILAHVHGTGDADGARGLVARGKALLLSAGTKVHVVYHSSESASVFVRSGLLIGEDCWVQPGWITAAVR